MNITELKNRRKKMMSTKPILSNQSQTVPNFPRRHVIDEMTLEEQTIFNLVRAIENLGGSVRLTDCVIKLGEAREALADHLEGKFE